MATNYKKLKSDLQKQGRMTLFVPHNEDLPCIGFEPTWSKTKILKALLQFDDIRKETNEIEVVTNLFLPTPPPEGYHIQLTGNYDEDEHTEWQQFLDENQWKIYPIACKYHTGILTKRRRCIIPTVIYPIPTRVHISNC